jgi:hypothetical protein
MSEYNWCHGPNCHKRHTTTRVRGVKGNKVLRTVKIRVNGWNKDTTHEYFCDQTCLMDFINKHMQEFVRLHPRTDCLETPINDPVKETIQSNWGNYSYTQTKIEVDDNRNIG